MALALWVIVLFIVLEILSLIYYKFYQEFFILRILLFLGIFIHEASHVLGCFLSGASVYEFKVGLYEGEVEHGKPRIPVFGNIIISLAPFFIGILLLVLLFMWILDIDSFKELFKFADPQILSHTDELFNRLKQLFSRVNLLNWKTWVGLILAFNILATFFPSKQDLKNISIGIIVFIAMAWFSFMKNINIILLYILIIADLLVLIATVFLASMFFLTKIFKKVKNFLIKQFVN